MPVRHRLTDADTLEALSLQYLGEETRVDDIINYNNLVYPYISTSTEDRYMTYAKGTVYVKRETAQSDIHVRKNWKLKTKPNIISSVSKTYVVIEDVTIPAGTLDSYIPVRAIVAGIQGNTVAESIQVLGDDFARNNVYFFEVKNLNSITGGTEGKVLTTGSYIFLPTEDADLRLDSTDAGMNQARYLYGEDLQLTDDDLTITVEGDLATVNFVAVVKQSVEQRLKAEKGDNPSDLSYGTDIPLIIGNGKIPKDTLPKRIEIEILQTLAYEDRIHSPVVLSVVVQEPSVFIDVEMKVVTLEEVLELKGLEIGGNINV